jgi:micrococcal nuclease
MPEKFEILGCKMKHILKYVIVFVIFLLAINLNAAIFKGICVKVIDGDTIVLYVNKKVLHIRFEAIDCPELKQDFGEDAKKFTNSMTFKKEVSVHIKAYDKYNRIVGRAYVNDQDLSLELVKAGLAWHDKKNHPDKTLAKAHKKAKKSKIGLWSKPSPMTPWFFRAIQKKSKDSEQKETQE